MNQKDKLTQDINSLKEMVVSEVERAYRKGFDNGAVLTASTIYRTFLRVGLEETNILYSILKDIAKNHNCDDLQGYVKELENKADKLN